MGVRRVTMQNHITQNKGHGLRRPRMPDINHSSYQWATGRPTNQIVHRSLLVAENKMIQSKQIIILDEIILAQNALQPGRFNEDTFHRAIGSIIVVGQIFGLMPVIGVLGNDASGVKFKWRCWRFLYTMVALSGGSLLCFSCVVRIFIMGLDINTVGMLVFYATTFLIQIMFLRLAPSWPRLISAISREELRRPPRVPRGRTLRTKFKLLSSFFLFMALVEHLLSVFSKLVVMYGCEKEKSIGEGFFISSYPQIFSYITYKHWKAVFLQSFNFAATFYWNFMDLFIILMSKGLSDGFDKLNECLDASIGKDLPEQFWRGTRSEYAHLAQLVRKIDEAINEIILLSFINNLYIICLQLFNSLKSVHEEDEVPCDKKLDGGITTVIYFVFSFTFLMSRFLFVSLSASWVHTSARRPLMALYSVSSESYCIEVQRFLDQVTTDTVALTGLNFFSITRGLILTIAGTVVTYELVLVQFNTPPSPVSTSITINETCGIPINSTVPKT